MINKMTNKNNNNVPDDNEAHIEIETAKLPIVLNEKEIEIRRIIIAVGMVVLCVILQYLRKYNFVAGETAITTALVLTTMACGLEHGIAVGMIIPVIEYILGQNSYMTMLPMFVPVYMFAYLNLVIAVDVGKKSKLALWLIIGCLAKSLTLWAVVYYILMPNFGEVFPEDILLSIEASYSFSTRLMPALLGAGIACLLYAKIETIQWVDKLRKPKPKEVVEEVKMIKVRKSKVIAELEGEEDGKGKGKKGKGDKKGKGKDDKKSKGKDDKKDKGKDDKKDKKKKK